MGGGSSKSRVIKVSLQDVSRFEPKDDEDDEEDLYDEQEEAEKDDFADEKDIATLEAEAAALEALAKGRIRYPKGHPATWVDGKRPSALPFGHLTPGMLKKLGPPMRQQDWQKTCRGSWNSCTQESWELYAKAWDIASDAPFDEVVRVGYIDRVEQRERWLHDLSMRYGEIHRSEERRTHAKKKDTRKKGAKASTATIGASSSSKAGGASSNKKTAPMLPELSDIDLPSMVPLGVAGGLGAAQKRIHGFPAGGMHENGY